METSGLKNQLLIEEKIPQFVASFRSYILGVYVHIYLVDPQIVTFLRSGYRMASEAARSTLEAAVRDNKDNLGTLQSFFRHIFL